MPAMVSYNTISRGACRISTVANHSLTKMTKRTRTRSSRVLIGGEDIEISTASVKSTPIESSRSSTRLKAQVIQKESICSLAAAASKPELEIVNDVKHSQDLADAVDLPLPWKGRLGYACLNTYLRTARPPVFCSRTCRLASIEEQRHPLRDPSQPAHPTKNRPDRSQPAVVERGQQYLKSLGLANARDLATILRWNERFGIRFFRLSSDMFPFASHGEHGYGLAPFAAEALAEAGRVAAAHGHRLTTHPGQYTQLGSPRAEVVEAARRDLAYHAEMLQLLRLPPQQDRDAVMVIHMGGVFGDKAATLRRFAQAYREQLDDHVRARLVLENDDVAWSVRDLLPVCEELGIPLVLDYHHHSLVHEAEDEADSGSGAVADAQRSVAASTGLAARIRATWTAKGITPKMHYSEPSAGPLATPHQRRKHSARVASLPPCPADADLMIEAKDKEQAVFDLMRRFQLPGFEHIGDVLPHGRADTISAADQADEVDTIDMGGPGGCVYWPEGREDWLRPKKRSRERGDSVGE